VIIQTNPEVFSKRLPVHTVTNIDRSRGIVTLSGSDGTSLDGGAVRPPVSQAYKTFHATADVGPATTKMRLVQIADENVSLLASDPNASVKMVVEISAEFTDGAKDMVNRAVSENANSLGLKSADWE
jgi:hypothetical protein